MLALLLAAPAAAAPLAVPTGDGAGPSEPEAAPSYRTGVVVGLALGGGIGRGAGYPNDSNDIGNPSLRSASRWMPGTSAGLLVMGALADYFDFGLWFAEDAFRDGTQRAVQDGLGLRVEAFPLIRLYPHLSGLGFMTEFGIGIGRLTTPGLPEAGGTQSYAAVGTFYEWSFGHFLGGHFGAGPGLEYDAMFSRSYGQTGLVAVARVVFYGGP